MQHKPIHEPTLNELRANLKQLKRQQGLIAGQFKQYAKNSAQQLALRPQMQRISHQVKQLQQQIKAHNTPTPRPAEPVTLPLRFSPLGIRHQRKAFHVYSANEPRDWLQWYAFAQRHPYASLYQQRAFIETLEQHFALKPHLTLARDLHGNILGGLVLCQINSRLFGRYAVSLPHVNYGGPLSECLNVTQALLQQAEALLESEQLSYLEVRSLQAKLHNHVDCKKVSMLLPLPRERSIFEKQLSAKVRAQCNKAKQHALAIYFDKHALLDDFYHVFSRNMRDLGTPVYHKTWFERLLNTTQLNTQLGCVYHQQRPVAAAFLLGDKDTLEIPWASCLRKANQYNANMWMYREILNFAIDEGYAFFDFGRATRNSGSYRFKKQWGAIECQHYWYRLSAQGNNESLNPDNPKFRLAIQLWQRLPLCLSRRLGPYLIKQLS